MSEKEQETVEKDSNTQTETTDETKPKISEHAIFDNGRIILKDRPSVEDVKKGIAFQQEIANRRLAENEDLVLNQVNKRLDEAFYTLWRNEVNSHFRLLLRYRNRAKKVKDEEKSEQKESA